MSKYHNNFNGPVGNVVRGNNLHVTIIESEEADSADIYIQNNGGQVAIDTSVCDVSFDENEDDFEDFEDEDDEDDFEDEEE